MSRMRGSFDVAARRRIQAALDARAPGSGEPVPCPVCGTPLTRSPIAAPSALPYVRTRVMLVCPSCEAGAVFDVRAGARP